MEFQILGPLRLEVPEGSVELRSVKRRGLLGMLLLHANSHVHADKIVQWLWAEGPQPERPYRELQKIVSQVRGVLRNTATSPEVVTDNSNYRLEINESLVDYHRFSQLAEEGRNARRNGDQPAAIKVLKNALALWPDEPVLANVRLPWARVTDETLIREDFIPACRTYFEARLAEEHYELVLREVRRLMRRHDTSETLAELYIRALMVTEGAAGVTEFYRGFTHRLRETFDAQPGPDLARVYRALLGRQRPLAAFGRPEPPCLLPRDSPDFLGRQDILRTLDDWLLTSGAPAVVALHGVGGVGKTAIVRRWAHGRSTSFPDGQLYFDLNGYGPGGPVKPATVLAAFLTALGIEDVPSDGPSRAALLRHKLRGRRILVVLDNVRGADEVEPLLEATSPCPVLITSRRTLGLADCRQLTVPAFDREDAVEMLRQRIYDPRAETEPAAIDDLAAVCADLPLGLRIAAEYVVTRSKLTIRALTDQLSAESRRRLLDARGDGREQTLRAVIASSCAALDPPADRLLMALGLHPSAAIGVPAAAAIGGITSAEAEDAFETLLGAHLVEQKTGDTYRLHDLVHAYVVDHTRRKADEQEQSVAVHRMADFYLGTVTNAIRWVAPQLPEVPPLTLGSAVVPLGFHDHDDAMNWCIEQRAQVLAVSRRAAEQGLPEHVWRLVGLFGEILKRHGDPHDVVDIHELAVRSARLSGDRDGEAMLVNNLGFVHHSLGEYRLAESCYQRALEISREVDSVLGEATCVHNIGSTWLDRGRPDLAQRLFEQGLTLFTEAGYEEGRAKAYLWLGDAHRDLGRPEAARRCYENALDIRERNGNPGDKGEALVRLAALHLDRGGDAARAVRRCVEALAMHRRSRDERQIAVVLLVLARAQASLGEHGEAVASAREAAQHADSCGDLKGTAVALELAGRSEAQLGDLVAARESWGRALALFEELGDPRASKMRDELGRLEAARVVPGQRTATSDELFDLPASGSHDDHEHREAHEGS